jgi:hypothetical protein
MLELSGWLRDPAVATTPFPDVVNFIAKRRFLTNMNYFT